MKSRARGQSLVEFALTVPILILFVLGIIDFGHYIFTYSEVENATRRASEFAAKSGLNPSKTACTTAAHNDAVKNFVLTDSSALTFEYSYSPARKLYALVQAKSTYTGTFMTPLARGIFGNNFTINFTSKRTVLSTRPIFTAGNTVLSCF